MPLPGLKIYLRPQCELDLSHLWSSIEIMVLGCLGFEKIAVLYTFWRQTDGQTDGQYSRVKADAAANGALIIYCFVHRNIVLYKESYIYSIRGVNPYGTEGTRPPQ